MGTKALTLAICDGIDGTTACTRAIELARKSNAPVAVGWDDAKGSFYFAELSVIEKSEIVWVFDALGNPTEGKGVPRT